MKKLLPLMLIFSLALFFACDTGGGSTTNPDNSGTQNPDGGTTDPDGGTTEPDGGTTDPDNGGSPILTSSVKLADNSGALLGYIIDVDIDSYKLITSKGYLITVNTQGELFFDSKDMGFVFYTNLNGAGTPFIQLGPSNNYANQYVFTEANGSLLSFRDVDSNGIIQQDSSITHYSSRFDGEHLIDTSNPTIVDEYSDGRVAYALKPVSKADIGFPTSITLPLQYTYPE